MTIWAKYAQVFQSIVPVVTVYVIKFYRDPTVCGLLRPPAKLAFRLLETALKQSLLEFIALGGTVGNQQGFYFRQMFSLVR